MARSAGAPMDPMFGVSLSGENRPGAGIGRDMNAMAAFELSQTFTVPGGLRSRREAGLAESRVMEAERSAMQREIAAEIRILYADLYALDREDEALRGSSDLVDLLYESARSRYSTGSGDMASLVGAQLEQLRILEMRQDLEAQRAQMVARLNGLLDRPAGTPIHTRGAELASTAAPVLRAADHEDGAAISSADVLGPQGPAGVQRLLDEAVAQSPAVVVERARYEASQRKLGVARLMRWPELTAGAEYGYRGALDPMITARLAVEIPVWRGSRQDAEVRAAEHEIAASRQDLRRAELDARAAAEQALIQFVTAARQARRYREEIEPRTVLAVETLRSAYATGGGETADLLDTTRTLLEVQSKGARREAERYQAWARWQALLGTDPMLAEPAPTDQGED